ncbi:MAG: hypothetical protein R6X28_11245 [Bacteroidales bacterium]
MNKKIIHQKYKKMPRSSNRNNMINNIKKDPVVDNEDNIFVLPD